MIKPESIGINESGNLTVGGVDSITIAKEYGTPVYVMDEALIRKNCRLYKDSIDKYYEGNGMVCYASKAFCCKAICSIMHDEKMGLDVVSQGELFTAINTKFPTEKILFHGNNKTEDELTLALSHGVGRIVVDNISELERLEAMAGKLHKKPEILLRLKPGVEAHTHSFISTGQIDSKFGFAIETGEAIEAVKKALSLTNVQLKGIHCHIGSQIFDIAPFQLAAKIMLRFMSKVKDELSYELTELDLGGGFGISYITEDRPIEFDKYMQLVSETVKEECDILKLKKPYIILEPGRSIVAEAGVTLYTVGAVKIIPGIRKYVTVDGGMGDNPRYALYGSKYEAVIANKAGMAANDRVTIAGKCCESGDLIGENIELQKAEVGDILAVLITGAYNYSMASNYNRISRPSVVMVANGKTKLIVKRETLEDIIRNDV